MIQTQISMTGEQAEALRRLPAVRQRSEAALGGFRGDFAEQGFTLFA